MVALHLVQRFKQRPANGIRPTPKERTTASRYDSNKHIAGDSRMPCHAWKQAQGLKSDETVIPKRHDQGDIFFWLDERNSWEQNAASSNPKLGLYEKWHDLIMFWNEHRASSVATTEQERYRAVHKRNERAGPNARQHATIYSQQSALKE